MARTGLALSDELGITTRGLPNLTPRSRAQDVAFLVGLCQENEVHDVAVGLPMLPSGDDTPMTRRARGFAAALEAGLREAGSPARVHLVDERGTSKAAAVRLAQSEIKKSERKGMLDSEAARILIEDLLASLPRGG